jgi:hypothetical protein
VFEENIMIAIIQPIAQATIEFIGIILFTTQPLTPIILTAPPNTPTLTQRTVTPAAQPNQYISPTARVGGDVAAGPAARPRLGNVATGQAVQQGNSVALAQDVAAILPPVPRGVESHTPLIAFPTGDFIDVSGWTKLDLREGLSYIVLSKGDLVTFQTGATNPRIGGPKNLPHLKSEVAALQSSQGLDLVAGYKAPGYSSAAAVVKLSEGVLQECASPAHGGRADTYVTLNTNGTLVIASGRKRLRLKTDHGDRFTVANVPLPYAASPNRPSPTNMNSKHYLAYCAMLNVPIANCPMPHPDPALQACLGTENMKTTDPMETLGGSADCSNTQWP